MPTRRRANKYGSLGAGPRRLGTGVGDMADSGPVGQKYGQPYRTSRAKTKNNSLLGECDYFPVPTKLDNFILG